MRKRFEDIITKWFLTEPALVEIYMTHSLEENKSLSCVMRCGKGRIEYNPNLVAHISDDKLELFLKTEIIRILLKHPYDRQPDCCRKEVVAIASNLVIGDNYTEFKPINIPEPSKYGLQSHESYEWYAYRLEGNIPKTEGIEDSHEPVMDITEDLLNDDIEDTEQSEFSEEQELENSQFKKKNDSQDSLQLNDDDSNQENHQSKESGTEESDSKGENNPNFISFQIGEGTSIGFELSFDDDFTPSLPVSSSNSNSSPAKQEKNSSGVSSSVSASNLLPLKDTTPKANFDLSSLWEEDFMKSCEIDSTIELINETCGWGTVPGNLVDQIIANTKARIDYRKVLSGFRASVLSSKRNLTRMRPNRRSGFDNLGSIRRFSTNILVAVDVSGSVDDESLKHFFSIINRTFKYGIEKLDLIQFDVDTKEVESFDKKKNKFDITGRGGTNFQSVYDYATAHQEYDGLIIFTDGCAPPPKKSPKMKCKVVWVCNNKRNYESNKEWMLKLGRCCLMEI